LHYTYEHLGAFTKFRKATISFVMPVRLSLCPPFRMEQLSSHWTDFSESESLIIFRKSAKKIKVSLKKTTITDTKSVNIHSHNQLNCK